MHYTKNSIANYQSGVELLLYNSLNQQSVKNTVTQFGYSEDELNHIYNLNRELAGIVTAVEQAKSHKRLVFRDKNALLAGIKKDYMRCLKLARIVLSEDLKAAEALMLNGSRARTYNELLFQISAFVSNLMNNSSWLNALNVYNISTETIRELQERLKQLGQLSDKCLEAQGEVRRLTDLKKKKLVNMQRYVSDYVKVVRIALEEKPKLLSSLGIGAKRE
ncbi:hypothetical protein KDU71_04665 [Carboxylicivirga sediminis]|uniref:Uncharacterized protein n=1 Tax=Carboxylicivirga sediminis TaxID=2006564 RepID=A0A941F0W7_9BACT|nr:hypothetical protein [Carboxylicivirga sediminis]MBR8534843.1 hypothetical protein [Carboxylicivirga sediminis]